MMDTKIDLPGRPQLKRPRTRICRFMAGSAADYLMNIAGIEFIVHSPVGFEGEIHHDATFAAKMDTPWLLKLRPDYTATGSLIAGGKVEVSRGEPASSVVVAVTDEFGMVEHDRVFANPSAACQDLPQINSAEFTKNSPEHSGDFRSVNWFGAEYTFSPVQAACIQYLWMNWAKRCAPVGQSAILQFADSDSSRLRDVFKRRDGMHKAWGTMVIRGQAKGTYRLNDNL